MSLSKQLSERFEKCSAGDTDAPITIQISHQGQQLSCHFDRSEEIACGVQKICLRYPDDKRPVPIAETLVQRVSYLLEPLSIIESDDESAIVQVRSSQPSAENEGRAYYELLVEPEQLTFCRYSQSPGQARQITSAWLTHEVVEKLVSDLEHALMS